MKLKYEKRNGYENLSNREIEDMYKFTDEYISFLNEAKTEYTCIKYFLNELKNIGAKDIETISNEDVLNIGDIIYMVNKDRSVFIAKIGNSVANGLNMIGAHIDSPRLDTKPLPLFEKNGLALLKTQYYGGIKKYQWLAIPLMISGVIYNTKNELIEINIGKEDGFLFTITDLLPHLSNELEKKPASEFIDPENLSVVCGSIPDFDEKDNKIKNNILKILNEKYKITEIDFAKSDLRFVPAFDASYIGFDKGLVAGYGQDDRVCAYSTVAALLNTTLSKKNNDKTCVAILVDKEEIGSVGATSMKSSAFDIFISKLIKLEKRKNIDLDITTSEVYSNSYMLSADVSAAIDPMHSDLSDEQNANTIGSGVSIEKYTGSGGKYNANDASAKFMAYVMNVFDTAKVCYQIGTLSKIGKGGGGTIAYILANKGVEVVDCGTALLSMHSPYELASVSDIFNTYKAYKAFFESK